MSKDYGTKENPLTKEELDALPSQPPPANVEEGVPVFISAECTYDIPEDSLRSEAPNGLAFTHDQLRRRDEKVAIEALEDFEARFKVCADRYQMSMEELRNEIRRQKEHYRKSK